MRVSKSVVRQSATSKWADDRSGSWSYRTSSALCHRPTTSRHSRVSDDVTLIDDSQARWSGFEISQKETGHLPPLLPPWSIIPRSTAPLYAVRVKRPLGQTRTCSKIPHFLGASDRRGQMPIPSLQDVACWSQGRWCNSLIDNSV